ncbi:hypothetical protein QWY86_15660 [Pedobacter aquatilis]|uniref:hypothetical protein n=1 Tax=Pedobacter aquatilis TaxID=351343 RepID=UPI0025B2AA62|nr:hypothetical protein [Pedobacter aquatilis]MDN3588120.1 hypothetical protein [Pedobacter aquatilis]
MRRFIILTVLMLTLLSNINAQNWNRTAFIAGDGVTEIGKYIDFHDTDNGLEDYSIRLMSQGNSLRTNGTLHAVGIGVNTGNISDAKMHIFGNSPSTTNFILSANYENSYRWKFKTIDRGSAIDLDIVGTNSGDSEEAVLKLSPSFSGRPELSFMNDWLIINNGDIGIGTSTPKEKLSVNGKIRAHEVKVETSNWPDYVFEEGYKVGTLEALESYIKVNKHLPEIPSANEVEKNGIALGEMNKQLLKKIEEMSLLMIDMNKKMLNLEKEVQQIKLKKD